MDHLTNTGLVKRGYKSGYNFYLSDGWIKLFSHTETPEKPILTADFREGFKLREIKKKMFPVEFILLVRNSAAGISSSRRGSIHSGCSSEK